MSNVIQFPGRDRAGNVRFDEDPDYSVHIRITPDGFDWDIEEHTAAPIDMGGVASDLAAIALSLRPPSRTFLERLKALIFGDDQ